MLLLITTSIVLFAALLFSFGAIAYVLSYLSPRIKEKRDSLSSAYLAFAFWSLFYFLTHLN